MGISKMIYWCESIYRAKYFNTTHVVLDSHENVVDTNDFVKHTIGPLCNSEDID
jgi:hypothetical protein